MMRRLLAPAAALLLAGCGSSPVSLWPFGEGGARELDRRPADAAEYRCDGGRRFFVRTLGEGAVWLFAPDREIRLERLGAAGRRYGAGNVVLELTAEGATLADPPASFTGCKPAGAK